MRLPSPEMYMILAPSTDGQFRAMLSGQSSIARSPHKPAFDARLLAQRQHERLSQLAEVNRQTSAVG